MESGFFLCTHINMYACRVVVICGWLLSFLSIVHIQQPATVILNMADPSVILEQQSATEQEETFVRIAEKALEDLHITSDTSADSEDQYPADQKSHDDGSVEDGADVAASVAAAEVDDEVPIPPSNDLHIPADKDEGAAEAKEEVAPPEGDLHISDNIDQEKKEENLEGSGTTLPSAAIAEAELIQESKESKEEEEESKEESKEGSAGARDGDQQ